MSTELLEEITKAKQTSNMLNAEVRQAHKLAIRENPILEIALRDVMFEAVKIQIRLAEIEAALNEKGTK